MTAAPLNPTTTLFAAAVTLVALMICAAVAQRGVPASTIEHQSTSYRINLNTADAATLQLLPGIGATVAEHIVVYRAAHGPFRSVDDIQNVRMIGPTIRRRVEPYVTLE